ncbi:Potassium voltage-gated channel protein eag, partial [Lucilia cuprina]
CILINDIKYKTIFCFQYAFKETFNLIKVYLLLGSPFWCLFDIVPIKNEKREVVLFLASHKDITHTKMLEMNSNEECDSAALLGARFRAGSNAGMLGLGGLPGLSGEIGGSTMDGDEEGKAPFPEYKTQALKKSRFILPHYGVFKGFWDWIILVSTFYVAILVPYNAAFAKADRQTMVSDVIVEALFIVDILLNFRTTFVSTKGEVVSDSKMIAINYLKGWFVVDLLAALPFDHLYASNLYNGEESHIHLVKLTRWMHALAERLKIPVSNITNAEAYSTALYFTFTSLTSVGFGNVSANTTAEKVFSIVMMLIGALMHAVVFGNCHCNYSTNMPKELKQRIEDYFQTSWSLNHGIDIYETLREFPEELRGDVSMHLHREILQLPIFEGASQGCLKLLSLHIKTNFCAPGEYLIHKGDALNYIYYLCNGSMEVIKDEMVVAILGKGDLVGSDINVHLVTTSNGQMTATTNMAGQDVVFQKN